jgi:hypothetical protein
MSLINDPEKWMQKFEELNEKWAQQVTEETNKIISKLDSIEEMSQIRIVEE